MPILRLAYTTQFLVALIAVFFLWSEIGGQGHLDLMPWYLKLGLGTGVAYAAVKATASAVAQESAWNIKTLKWFSAMLALLVACGVVTYYYHLYGEDDDQQDAQGTSIAGVRDTLSVHAQESIGDHIVRDHPRAWLGTRRT
ncbi:MAG: hypothetical protein ABSG03_11340 [Bryobacteraceae bacterium]|jgi:hypothetical protein